MAYEMKSALPTVPDNLMSPIAHPRTGAYHGSIPEVDLRPRLGTGWTGKVKTVFKLKRWHFAAITTPEICICFAVIDAGLAANAFCYVVDLNAGRLLVDRTRLGPPRLTMEMSDRPGEGARARFDLPRHHLYIHRKEGTASYQVRVRSGELDLEAVLNASRAPDPLTVLMPLRGGDLDFTQKTVLMPVTGTLHVGHRSWDLASGFGGIDFTHGLFARRTAWRWGFGMGRADDGVPIAFNLTDGLSDARENENVLWVDNEMIPVDGPRFKFQPNRLEAGWEIHTEDGAIDLRFSPKGIHREERNLVALESHFAQIGGVFTGTVRDSRGVKHTIDALTGVAEDQRVLW